MPRQRSPDRDRAYEIYKQHKGKIKLVDIAKELGLDDGQIRKWKCMDKWDDKMKGTLPKKKRNVPKQEKQQGNAKSPSKKNKVLEPQEMDLPLTEKQKLFAEIYVKNFNATQAAIKAGYSPDTAYTIGYENLRKPKVKAYITYLKELKKEAIMLNEDDIVERYMKIAFADMTDFVSFGQENIPVVVFVDPKTNTPIMANKKVNFLNVKEDFEVDGGLICEIKVGKQGTSLKLEDRQKALSWLADYFGMNPEHRYRKMFDEKKLQLEREKFEHQKEMDEKGEW